MRFDCALHARRADLPIETLAIRDGSAQPDTPCDLYEYFGISSADAVAAVSRHLSHRES